jgi:signal transduction histidine kinase
MEAIPSDDRRAGKPSGRLKDRAVLAERFCIALEDSPVIVFNQDRLLRYTWINSPSLCWAATDYIGRTDKEIVGGIEGERLTTVKTKVLETGVATRVEAAVTFNSETHYFDLTVKPLRDDVGSIEGITCACSDITPIKHVLAERERLIEEIENAHRELARRNTALEALHKQKMHWLGIAAHDLCSPLSAILFNCDAIAESAGATSEQMSVLPEIKSSTQSMLALIGDLLDISAIETGKRCFFLEPTDLTALIGESIARLRPQADRKSIHIEAQWPERIPAINLDRRTMTRVFLNLIENSIRFCQIGAVVQIDLVIKPPNLVVRLRDNGAGISPAEIESIFVPFQRGEGTGSVKPGSGLGLAICKRLVELHGGCIWAENAVGGGAVISLSLPLDVHRNLDRTTMSTTASG